MNISIVKNWIKPVVTSTISFVDYFNVIADYDSAYREGIERVRNDIPNKDVIKAELPCALPHGTFKYGSKKDIIAFSDHLYIDLDPKDHEYAIQMRDSVMELQFIRAAWLSPSGTGVHLIIYCPGLNKRNFDVTLDNLHEVMTGHGYNPDPSAKGLSRKMVISFDPDIKINPDPAPFDVVQSTTFQSDSPIEDYSLEQISNLALSSLFDRMKVDFRSPEDFSDNADYHLYPDGKEVVRLWFQKKINDHRNNTLCSAASKLLYLNPWLVNSRKRFRSLLSYINQRVCYNPVGYDKICQMVDWAIKLKTEGTLQSPEPELKKVIVNRALHPSSRQAQSIAAKGTAVMKREKKIRLLKEAYSRFEIEYGRRPTQKELHEFTCKDFKVGIRTVQGYWNLILCVQV